MKNQLLKESPRAESGKNEKELSSLSIWLVVLIVLLGIGLAIAVTSFIFSFTDSPIAIVAGFIVFVASIIFGSVLRYFILVICEISKTLKRIEKIQAADSNDD